MTTALVVAAFDGPSTRFLCKDAKRGYWVSTPDIERAQRFEGEANAREALADWDPFIRQYGGGDWRVYEMTNRISFAPA